MHKLLLLTLLVSACSLESEPHSVPDAGEEDAGDPFQGDIITGRVTAPLTRSCNVWTDVNTALQAYFPSNYPEAGNFPAGTTCRFYASPDFFTYECHDKHGAQYLLQMQDMLQNGFLSFGAANVTTWKRGPDNFFRFWGVGEYTCNCTRSPSCAFWGLVVPQ